MTAGWLDTPVGAQVSGPIFVDPESQQKASGGNGNYLNPEQQNWNQNNLDTTGTGKGYVGALDRYEINAGGVNRGNKILNIRLGWTPPSTNINMVKSVEFEILGGRRTGSQPASIVDMCPSLETISVYMR